MFSTIFLFELKYWLRRPAFYIYLLTFSAISCLGFVGTAGLFDPHSPGASPDFLNSPYNINSALQYFNKFFLFLIPAIVGAGLYKDYKNKVFHLLYTFPINKISYLAAKFLSGFIIVGLITIAVAIGMMIGEMSPGLDPSKVGPFRWAGYAQVYLWYILPNMLFFGVIIFCIVLWFRNIYAGFSTAILLFLIQAIIQNSFSQRVEWIALLDPFAHNTMKYITRAWSINEQNHAMIPIDTMLIWNRLIWAGIAGLVGWWSLTRFQLHVDQPLAFRAGVAKTDGQSLKPKANPEIKRSISYNKDTLLPKKRFRSPVIRKILTISNLHLAHIVQSWIFLGITVLGLLFVIFTLGRVTNTGDMLLHPVTHLILEVPAFFFSTIIMLLTFLYSGMLIYRERNCNMDALVDATSVSNSVTLIAKFIAILKMQLIMLSIMLIAGIMIQIYNGYYHFELHLYAFHLYIVQFSILIIWAMASFIVHTYIPNVYLGIFVLIGVWIASSNLSKIGLDSRIFSFNAAEPLQYSDLDQYGIALRSFFLTTSYWLVCGMLMMIATYLSWQRGLIQGLQQKIQVGKIRFSKSIAGAFTFLLLAFISLAFKIVQTENASPYLPSKQENVVFEAFTKKFNSYGNLEQPKITDVELAIDLFPQEQRFTADGIYTIVNSTLKPIDTLLLKMGFGETTTFDLDRSYRQIEQDTYVQFNVLRLDDPMLVNDTITLNFKVKNKENTVFEKNSDVLSNGTFLMQDFLPRIGYHLNSQNRSPKDSLANKVNFYTPDAHTVNLTTTISTSSDQIAIAPGYCQKEWSTEGRNYYTYTTEAPIKFVLGFNSGKFDVVKEKWQNVDLEIYHHPSHIYNIKSMLKGLRAALDYNSKNFSPYQHRQARIIEFPMSKGSFATAFANSIPTSEFRFISKPSDDFMNPDLAFYVAAHELTHQWWGEQVIPASALGAKMLTESITEYITLQIYREHKGDHAADRFRTLQHRRYMRGRNKFAGKEPPIIQVESEQQFIAYGKGTLIFQSLANILGSDSFNSILQDFLLQFNQISPPYPTSINLVTHLKERCPDSIQYLIKDHFESVTTYDNKITGKSPTKTTQGKMKIELDLTIEKFSNVTKVGLNENEYVEVGFYDKENLLLEIQRVNSSQLDNSVLLEFSDKASKIVLDPNMLVIDRNLDDNTITL